MVRPTEVVEQREKPMYLQEDGRQAGLEGQRSRERRDERNKKEVLTCMEPHLILIPTLTPGIDSVLPT